MDVHGDRYQPALLLPLRLRLDVHGGIPDLRAPGQGRTSSCMPYLLGHIRHTVPIALSLKELCVSAASEYKKSNLSPKQFYNI